MAIDERARRRFFEIIDETLGPEASDYLMNALPAEGWTNVATRADIVALEAHLATSSELQELRHEMNALRVEIHGGLRSVGERLVLQTRWILIVMVGFMSLLTGIFAWIAG